MLGCGCPHLGNGPGAGARLQRHVRRLASPQPPRRPPLHGPPDHRRRQARPRRLLRPPQRGVAAPPLPRPEAEPEPARPRVPDRGRPAPPRGARRSRPRGRDRGCQPLRHLARRAATARSSPSPSSTSGTAAGSAPRSASGSSPQARASGIGTLTGSTFALNEPAKALLRRLGFRPTGVASGVAEYELAPRRRAARRRLARRVRGPLEHRAAGGRPTRRGGRRSAPRSRARRPATSRAAARRPVVGQRHLERAPVGGVGLAPHHARLLGAVDEAAHRGRGSARPRARAR